MTYGDARNGYSSNSGNNQENLQHPREEHGKPLQLVRLGRREDFETSLKVTVDTAVLDAVLETCGDRKVGVITVTGSGQSGKTFLLNCIKAKLSAAEKDGRGKQWLAANKVISGFHCNRGYKTVNEGIWIWSRAFLVKAEDDDDEEMAVLLMETQGFHDEFTQPDEISALLGISVLTSSIVVLNFSADLPTEAFDWLETISEFGDLLRKKEVPIPFQKLSFVIRDWTRINDYDYGDTPGKRMLMKKIKFNRNVGENLENFWEELDCFLMPHIGGQALLQTFTGRIGELNEEFSKKLKTYVNNLTNPDNLSLKKMMGNALTAAEWKKFFITYAALYNNKSETEWGLQPESIWGVTKEAAGEIKIDHGVSAYLEVFRQRKATCPVGYFQEASIDAAHVQAKRKAFESFAELALPKQDEKSFKGKLEQLLEKEKEKLKLENKTARTTKVAECVGKACEKLRNELNFKFPFAPVADKHGIPVELIFYEEPNFSHAVRKAVDDVQRGFLDQFPTEDEEGLRKLRETLDSVIQSMVQGYTGKNADNFRRVKAVTDGLMDGYRSAMLDLVTQLPNTDSSTLGYIHGKEVKTVKQKFDQLNISNASLQEQWWEALMKEMENEYETMETNLDSTMRKAVEMVEAEQRKYREDLTEKANEMGDGDEIQEYHQIASKSILRKFSMANPLCKDATRAEAINRRLKGALNMAYIEIVEEGIIAKKNMEEKLKQARNSAVEYYKEEVSRNMDEAGDFIFKEDDFSKISEAFGNATYERYEKEIGTISGLDAEILQKELDQFEKDFKAFADYLKGENNKRRELAEGEAHALYTQCNQDFEARMTTAVAKIKSREDLVQEFEKMHGNLTAEFNSKCATKNKELREKYIQKLMDAAVKIFNGVEEFFNMKVQAENVGLMTALVEVKQQYYQKMEGHFRGKKNGYFSEEELKELHENEKKAVLETAIEEHPLLTEDQRKEVNNRLVKLFQQYRERNELKYKSHQDEEPTIGIDLGTTYCCVASFHMGEVQIIQSSLGESTTPSYVTINQDTSATCGKTAKDLAFQNPESTVYDAKRIIGRRMNDKNLQSDMKLWPFVVEEVRGVPKVKVDDVTYFPEEISSKLLKHLKEEAEQFFGREVTKAVITVPAYFTDGQRKATLDAGEMAGLEVLGILNEPTAAAVAYRNEWFHDDAARRVLVFDLGGGTFDVVVIEMSQDKIEARSIGGDDHLGGQDFDTNLMNYCVEKFKQETGIDLFLGIDSDVKTERDQVKRRLQRLRASCEEVKKQLTTSRSKGTVSFASFAGGRDLIVDVTKEEFERQNAHLFQQTLDIVDKCLESAKLKKEDIHEVVLVGGSTRIPKVQNMLKEHFGGKALNRKIKADEAVAHGAAIQAAILNAKPGTKLFDFGRIQEVTPMSLGIELNTKAFDTIIRKNTKIPTEFMRTYYTYKDGQTNMWIKIFQGENQLAAQNKMLGHFILDGIPPAPKGKEAADVTFLINANGIITVKAVCKTTGGEKSITISEQESGRMTEEEKRRILGQNPDTENTDSPEDASDEDDTFGIFD